MCHLVGVSSVFPPHGSSGLAAMCLYSLSPFTGPLFKLFFFNYLFIIYTCMYLSVSPHVYVPTEAEEVARFLELEL